MPIGYDLVPVTRGLSFANATFPLPEIGGGGGNPFDDMNHHKQILQDPYWEIASIVIRGDDEVDGFRVVYRRVGVDHQEKTNEGTRDEEIVTVYKVGAVINGPWRGGNGGHEYIVDVPPGEYIAAIQGDSGDHIDQIQFLRNGGGALLARRENPTMALNAVGNGSGHGAYKFGDITGGQEIIGFHGHAGGLIDKIGVYVRPRRT